MSKLFAKLNVIILIAATLGGGFAVSLNLSQASAFDSTAASSSYNYNIQLKNSDLSELQNNSHIQNLQQLFGFSKNQQFANTYSFQSDLTLAQLQTKLAQNYKYLEYNTKINTDQASINLTPNDPGFTKNGANIDKQWGLVKSGFLDAWKKTTGDPDVVIAIVDTGIDSTHEDLRDSNFVNGYNILTQKTITRHTNSDDNGHGTLVAGVIGASTNNNIGIAGAAYGTTLMAVKALSADGTGASADISQGIVWAADHGADVINLSLGGIGFAHDTTLANAITYAFDKDVVIVAAAGNDVAVTGGNLDVNPVFPICDDNGKNMIIGVTATDVNDLKPGFANYGKACVDVSAPGRRILSTINHDPATGGPAANAYAYASGTSLSVPFVSAEAGLLRSLYPDASNKQIRDRIISTADNIDNLNLSQCANNSCRGLLGAGRINVAKSLETKISAISDGDVVQIEGTMDFYLINGGKKQRLSPFVRDQRYRFKTVIQATKSDLENFPEGSYAEPVDGTLVKSPNDPAVYMMQSGLRSPITYQVFMLRNLSFTNVITLTNVEVESWVTGSFLIPPDGTMIRSTTNPTVYWTVGGVLHPVNGKFYIDRGLNIFHVIYMSDKDITKFQKGDSYIL